MSYIPDCREDANYNEKYLNEEDSQYVLGFDHCIEDCIENFFDNIDMYGNELGTNVKWLKKPMKKLLKAIKKCMLDYSEIQRDEMITGLIDGYSEEEHESLKKAVDSGEIQNAISRYQEYLERLKNGEIPTCFTYKKDEKTGDVVKMGLCPNGNKIKTVIKKDKED